MLRRRHDTAKSPVLALSCAFLLPDRLAPNRAIADTRPVIANTATYGGARPGLSDCAGAGAGSPGLTGTSTRTAVRDFGPAPSTTSTPVRRSSVREAVGSGRTVSR